MLWLLIVTDEQSSCPAFFKQMIKRVENPVEQVQEKIYLLNADLR